MYLRYGERTWEPAVVAAEPAPASVPTRTLLADIVAPVEAARPAPPTIELRGVRMHKVTETDCVRHILDALAAGRGGVVVTPNLDHLRRCSFDLTFRALIAEADLVVADGMPLVWASRLQGTPLPQRVAGSNLIWSLSAAAAEKGRSVFLLGGSPGAAEAAAEALCAKSPGLRVVGTHCPSISSHDSAEEIHSISDALLAARPDVVFVALGSPKQEKLIARLRPLLPKAWWLGVGISFSFLSGEVRRAPAWMQSAGLEWTHRLAQEPRRLFKRYIVNGFPFAADLLARSACRGAAAKLRRRRDLAAAIPAVPVVREIKAMTGVVESLEAAPPSPPGKTSLQLQIFVNGPHLQQKPRLRALVLLGGSIRPTPLGAAASRSLLDLPLNNDHSILTGWLAGAAALQQHLGLGELPVRLAINRAAPEPLSGLTPGMKDSPASFHVERDLSDFRGTGGVIRDVADGYHDDDLILVANAAQVLMEPLPNLFDALHRRGGDVAVVGHHDGTPSGVMLLACRTLRMISAEGFVDMKEQALPRIATAFDVRVHARRMPSGFPLRTLADYVMALRCYHDERPVATAAALAAANPLAENLLPAFAIREPGARVDASARLHDSVVLQGGIVEAGAVLVRSLVGPGAVVRRDEVIVESIVTRRKTTSWAGFGAPSLDRAAALF